MSYTHKKKLTITHRPDVSLSNCPVRVEIVSDSDMGARVQSDGYDLTFKTTSGAELDHIRCSWTGGGGSSVTASFVVKLPLILSSADLEIECHYGGGAVTDPASTTLSITDLIGAWNLEENGNGTTDEYKDWSGNSNHLTGGGGFGSSYQSTPTYDSSSKFAAGITGDGPYDCARINSNFSIGSGPWTIGGWVRVPDTSRRGAFFKLGDLNDGIAFGIGSNTMDSNGNHLLGLHEGKAWLDSNDDVGTGWHHVAMTHDGNSYEMFLDGVSVHSGSSDVYAPAAEFRLCGYSASTGSGYPRYFLGDMDDWRVYDAVLSDALIEYTYAQGNSTGSWGSEQSLTEEDVSQFHLMCF